MSKVKVAGSQSVKALLLAARYWNNRDQQPGCSSVAVPFTPSYRIRLGDRWPAWVMYLYRVMNASLMLSLPLRYVFSHTASVVCISRCVQLQDLLADRMCALECGPDKPCYSDTCCARRNATADVKIISQADSLRSNSRLSSDNTDTRRRRFIDIINPYIRHKRQTDDPEYRPNGVVNSPDSIV